jgi:hypothetical protein
MKVKSDVQAKFTLQLTTKESLMAFVIQFKQSRDHTPTDDMRQTPFSLSPIAIPFSILQEEKDGRPQVCCVCLVLLDGLFADPQLHLVKFINCLALIVSMRKDIYVN